MRFSLATLLLWFTAGGLPVAAQEPVYTDNVVIILDGSGSMREKMARTDVTKLAAAKQALHGVLAQLPASTHVGVVAFSSAAPRDWLVPLGPQDPARLTAAINGLVAGGGTPLGRYMKLGADRLLEQRDAQYGYGTYRLLVVTDGEAKDHRMVNAHTTDIVSRGITIDAIGVDMQQDHTLATRVHSYRRADDPESLRAAIADVFAEVSAVVDGDTADEDAFAVIAPLPDELAVALVQSLSASGNHPIGARPAAGTSAASDSRDRSAPIAPVRQPARSAPESGMGVCFGGAVLVLVAGGIAAAVLRRARG